MSDRLLTAAEVGEPVAKFGCPLVAAARHPEQRASLMAFNAEHERAVVSGIADAQDRIRRALEDVLRARARRARRGA